MSQPRRNNNNCCVEGCFNKQNNSRLSFFALPQDVERRNHWLKLIGRQDLLNKPSLKHNSYKLCSMHFKKSQVIEVCLRKLVPDATPSELLPVGEEHQPSDGINIATQTTDSFLSTIRKNKRSRTEGPVGEQRAETSTSNKSEASLVPEPRANTPPASTSGESGKGILHELLTHKPSKRKLQEPMQTSSKRDFNSQRNNEMQKDGLTGTSDDSNDTETDSDE